MYGGGLAFWWVLWHAPRMAAIQGIVRSLPLWCSVAGTVVFFFGEAARWVNRRWPIAGRGSTTLGPRLLWLEFVVTPFVVNVLTVGSQRSAETVLVLWLAFFFAGAYDTIREERRAQREQDTLRRARS
jgi:hypothetical protein